MFEPNSHIMQLILAFFIGAFIGIQREMHINTKTAKSKFLGIRTTIFIAILGVVSTFFEQISYLPIISFLGLVSLILISHAYGSFKYGRIDLATELSGFLIFFIGVLIGFEEQITAIMLTIVITILGTFREQISNFVGALTKEEWLASVQLLVFSGAILPFLPHESMAEILESHGYHLDGIIKFILEDIVLFKIWLLVLFISGIGFIGYFLSKFIGAKGGIPISAFLGALSSSTAVTISLASQEKTASKNGTNNTVSLIFIAGILIGIATMMLRVILEIFVIGGMGLGYGIYMIPGSMAIVSFVMGIIYIKRYSKEAKKSVTKAEIKLSSPFEILPAIKFAGFYVVILILINTALFYSGDIETLFKGLGGNLAETLKNFPLYITAFISGFADVDAIVLKSMASVNDGKMIAGVAIITIAVAVFMNTLIKILYIFINGSKHLGKNMAMLISILCGVGAVVTLLVA